jgi:hypothetical protein
MSEETVNLATNADMITGEAPRRIVLEGLPSGSTIASELYRRAENDLLGHDLTVLMRNGGLQINVLEIRLGKALVALRTVRPCVVVYRDRYDFTLGTAMLSDLDAVIARMEEQQ